LGTNLSLDGLSYLFPTILGEIEKKSLGTLDENKITVNSEVHRTRGKRIKTK
jgi:hypothetical protein